MDSHMPIQGATVMTSDHETLGKVKEIKGDCFKVDAPLAPDYWLGSDTITTTSRTTRTRSAPQLPSSRLWP
jgi:hypothetical protein